MKAIRIHNYGGPEVLRFEDLQPPAPGPGEVAVDVAFAGINFMDINTRQGRYANSQSYDVRLPATLGMEGAGVVRQVGDGDTGGLAVGDRVAWCISWGSYADVAVVPAARVAPVPDGVGLDLAAAAMFQGCTAHYLINDVGRLSAGDTCLVHAASGSIAQLLIQFAKQHGATVLATTSTEAKKAAAEKTGADHVFLYDDGAFADRVLEATGGRGVDVVFDSLGKLTLRDSFRATRTRGLVVNSGSVGGSLNDLDPLELGEAGSLFLTRPRLSDYLADRDTVRRRAADVFAGLLDGSLRVALADRVDFTDVNEAHAALEERRQTGKSVLAVNPSLDPRAH